MADIRVIKYDANGRKSEHNPASDDVTFASFSTANNTLTDALLGDLAGALTDASDATSLHMHDSRYFREDEFINASVGAADAGKPIVLDASGLIDPSLYDATSDHGALTGLADDDHTQYILEDGTRAFSGSQSMGSNQITSLSPGTLGTDAVNKDQLDAVAAGFDLKERVRVATDAALPAHTAAGSQVGKTLTMTANGILTVDGIATVLGDRILVKDETAGAHINHGIYEVTTEGTAGVPAVLTRSIDADGSPASEVTNGMFAFVLEGTQNGNEGWAIITADPIVVDTTAIEFSQFQGLPAYTASLGVQLVGQDFRASLLASGGLKLTGNDIGIEPADFAGEGIVDDGADNLAIDWSTAFNDSKAIKASDLSSIVNGFGASIIGVEDAADNFIGADIESVLTELHTLAVAAGDDALYTVGAGGVTKGDLVYISSNNTVLPYATITGDDFVVGIAMSTESAAGSVAISRFDELLAGVLVGAVAGTEYYWTGSALTASPSFIGNENVWMAGVAVNATDLSVEVRHLYKKI